MERREITHEAWRAEGRARFGDDPLNWRFVCPVCAHEAAVREWVDAGASNAAGFSCIGRYREPSRDAFAGKGAGPCNYAGGGLFGLNPVRVVQPDGRALDAFEFGAAP